MQNILAKSKFEIGQLVCTRGVNDLMAENSEFAKAVTKSLNRYISQDWGDLCKEDKKTNEDALKYGERLFARYDIEPESIYIITEYDRSVTTILYPREY